jgi:ferredoxin
MHAQQAIYSANGVCIDKDFDDNNCGKCRNVCPWGLAVQREFVIPYDYGYGSILLII